MQSILITIYIFQPKKKELTEENLRQKEKEPSPPGPFTHDTKRARYARNSKYLHQQLEAQQDQDDEGSESADGSVIINPTPARSDDGDDNFPNTGSSGNNNNNNRFGRIGGGSTLQSVNENDNSLRLTNNGSGRPRFGSTGSSLGNRRGVIKRPSIGNKRDGDDGNGGDEKKGGDDNGGDEKNNDIMMIRSAPQEVVEILKRQENMLFRIQTQMNALDRQIKLLDNEGDDDLNSEMRECIHELQYLKTSSMAELSNELSTLKMELFDGFESISISSAFNVSQDIKKDLHSMNNVIDRTVRLWGNDWNVKKRVISNQQKLDHVLFKAEKILRKYQEMQSNLKTMKLKANNNIKMNVPQFISEMDTIRTSLKSMDNYLNTFVFDRLSRMENALIRIFQQSSNLQDPNLDSSASNKTIKRFSVDELMNQLDSQRLKFEGELMKKSTKINNQKQEITSMRDTLTKEREKLSKETEIYANLKAKYEKEQSVNKQLQFDLKSMKSQLQRLSMFNNQFGSGQGGNDTIDEINGDKKNKDDDDDDDSFKMNRMATVAIHPDISIRGSDDDELLRQNVDLSLEFDKFYTNSLSSLIGDFISKAKLDNKEKANEYHKSKERGHLMFRKDEVPKFLANKNNRDAQQQELEERLGFGYEELYYLFRENTEINVRCERLQHENKSLRARLKEVEPVIVVENVQNVSITVQNQLTKLYEKLKDVEGQYKEIEAQKKTNSQEAKFIDKYRIEMLQDAKKVEQEIQSQMNYDKFQFQRQRKKMNALMKSEKEGVLKEREIMEEERQEIEELKSEWKNKLADLEKRESEFDEKVEVAKTNMNEVVFQKGLAEYLKTHQEETKHELRQEVEKEAIQEKTEEIRNECSEQIQKQREYYNKRYSIANSKHDKALKEIDQLKLQITHLNKQAQKLQDDVLLRDEHYERMSGQYDVLEREYQLLKKEYKILEKTKSMDPSESDSKSNDNNSAIFKKYKRQKKKKDGILPWLEDESDDDEITTAEKKSIRTWLRQRHGDWDKSPNHNNHWLVLPQDKLAGKEKDIEDLQQTVKTLKQELDSRNKQIGTYKQQIDDLKSRVNGEDYLLKKLENKNRDAVNNFSDDIDTVKKWLRVWEDGIKTVTKAQDKWTLKNSELIKKEKEIQKEKEDLIYDQRMWYAHKNHILRRFYYFTKQVWWERFMVHEFQKSRADQEMAMCKGSGYNGPKPSHHLECPMWNQYYKMMLEAWFEAGVYQHALTRWFCQYNTYSKEKDLFYYADNDNNEELYVFKGDVIKKIQPHLDSIVERYYKQKWMKRRMKFGRCFIAAEKPTIIVDKSFNGFQKVVRDLFHTLHEKEPSYHQTDIKEVIQRAEQEMDDKIKGFTRQAWDMVKMTDGVGVVPAAEQRRKSRRDGTSTPRKSQSGRRKSEKKVSTPLPKIKMENVDKTSSTQSVSTPKQTRTRRVRIAPQNNTTLSKVNDGIADNGSESKYDDDEKSDRAKKRALKRSSMKTPKAGGPQKTWSHAMDNFKSVSKKQQKKLSPEEKKKLRQKRKQSRHAQQKSSQTGGDGRGSKRSSVKNPMSNLGGSSKNINAKSSKSNGSGIKSFQPETSND